MLDEFKLIGSFETHMRPMKAYYLSDAGYKYLESVDKLRVLKRFSKSEYKLTQFSHTVLGIHLRLIFQKHPYVVEYRPEKVVAYYQALYSGKEPLKRHSRQCDAEMLIKMKNSDYKAGVELELTLKSFKRLIGIMKHIDVNRDDLDVVLWVASSETIIRSLRRAIKKLLPQLRHPNKHLFALWKDLNSRQINTVWCNAEGQKTKLFD